MGHFNKSDKKHLDLDSEMGLMIAEVELTLNLSISRQLVTRSFDEAQSRYSWTPPHNERQSGRGLTVASSHHQGDQIGVFECLGNKFSYQSSAQILGDY